MKLFNDGDFVIYNVQAWIARHKTWCEWIQIGFKPDGSFDHARLPDRAKPGRKRGYGGVREPFASFTPGGECWQKTGIEGTFDRAVAEKLVAVLREHDSTLKLRITEMRISQHTRVVAEAGP